MSYRMADYRLGQLARDVGRALCSFETLFVLFLFSGTFRLSPFLPALPSNLTLLFMIASGISGMYILIKRHWRVPSVTLGPLVWFGALFLWIVLSVCWAPIRQDGLAKAANVLGSSGWAAVAGLLIIGPSQERVRRFVILLCALATLGALMVAPAALSGGVVVAALGSNYLTIGRQFGLAIAALAGYLLLFPMTAQRRGALALPLLILCLALICLPGRGPLLATVAALLGPLVLGVRIQSGSLRIKRYVVALGLMLFILVLLFGVYLILGGTLPTSMTRMLSIANWDALVEDVRIDMLRVAWNAWRERPLVGQGIGSFYRLYQVMGALPDADLAWPHNIVAELLVELGGVGLLLFGGALTQSLRPRQPARLFRDEPWRVLLVMLLINTFVNALFSSDLAGNRLVFLMMGILGGYSSWQLPASACLARDP